MSYHFLPKKRLFWWYFVFEMTTENKTTHERSHIQVWLKHYIGSGRGVSNNSDDQWTIYDGQSSLFQNSVATFFWLCIFMHDSWETMVNCFAASRDMMKSSCKTNLWHRQWQIFIPCHGNLLGCCWASLNSSGVLKRGQMMCAVPVIPQHWPCHSKSMCICVVCGETHISMWRCTISTLKNYQLMNL